jgi:hypothetical protein
MTAWQEQRQLHEIEAELMASAPGLAGMLRTFTRLTEGERPCGMERFPRRGSRLRDFLGQPGIVGVLALTAIVVSGMLLAVLASPGPRQCPGRAVTGHTSRPAGSASSADPSFRSLMPAGGGCPVYITKR